jgi:hypothetical protein
VGSFWECRELGKLIWPIVFGGERNPDLYKDPSPKITMFKLYFKDLGSERETNIDRKLQQLWLKVRANKKWSEG